MKIKTYIFIVLIFSIFYANVSAQDTTKSIFKDSVLIYKQIHQLAAKNKFTYWLYGFVFNEKQFINNLPVVAPQSDPSKTITDNYLKYEGKIIRDIQVITLDPFGTSLIDPDNLENTWLKRTGNKLHIKTNKAIIRNQLMFKKEEPLEPIKLRESERILRQQTFIRDALIRVDPFYESKDSVDILVVVRDVWSLTAYSQFKPIEADFELTEKNFLGWGHQFENNLSYDAMDPEDYTLRGTYNIPYIQNTFVSANATYTLSPDLDFQRFSLNRPFYSQLTKWAGGGYISRQATTLLYNQQEDLVIPAKLTDLRKYAWLGKSFSIKNGRGINEKATNFIVSGSINHAGYIDRPSFKLDTAHVYKKEIFYLSSIGFSSQRFYKDRQIFRFGIAEDVAEGRVLAFIFGLQKREFFTHRFYTGIKASDGKHIKGFGHLTNGIEYGTFIRTGIKSKGVVNYYTTYFSDLMKVKRWSFRQFVDYKITMGLNRDLSETVSLNTPVGINSFISNEIRGQSKMVLNTQSVFYLPYNVIGFRFAGFLFAGFGTVGNRPFKIFRGKVYQAYGIGLLIRNENLVIKTIRLSFGIYPNIPDDEVSHFKVNALSITDFRLRNFFYQQPETISYQ